MKISVIIPVFNVEEYLQKCVDSILGQMYRDIEVLLVDDGSTDSSSSLCDTYAENDSRVRVFHKQNEGVSRARNYGLEKARGEWIWFVDSDDYAEADTLQRFLDVLGSHPYIDVYKFGFVIEKEHQNTIISSAKSEKIESTSRMVLELETNCYTGFVWNMIFHRSLLGDKKFSEEVSYCEDHLFSYSLIASAKMMYIDKEVLYHYIVRNSDSLSNIYGHSAMSIVLSAYKNREARLSCIESKADKDVVKKLLPRVNNSFGAQLYIAYEVLYSHPFNFKESREVFKLINNKLPTVLAWMYYYIRYKIHKYLFERSQK